MNAFFSNISIKLFTGSGRISQKRFVSSEVNLRDGCSSSISLCVSFPCFIFLFCYSRFLHFQILGVLFKIKQQLKVQESKLRISIVENCWMVNLRQPDISIQYNTFFVFELISLGLIIGNFPWPIIRQDQLIRKINELKKNHPVWLRLMYLNM